jgi:hypothetical protein
MDKNLHWFQKEINKDKKEVEDAKKKLIKDILQTPKENITRGSLKLKKESIWKRILKKLKHL